MHKSLQMHDSSRTLCTKEHGPITMIHGLLPEFIPDGPRTFDHIFEA